ncbi:MAG: hypothetical protein QNL93_09775 [Opitutae bacterium]|jgi:hypothetical protein
MNIKAHFLSLTVLGWILLYPTSILDAQDLPGTSLPGSSTTIPAPGLEAKPEEAEKKKLDPAMVKEIKDVVKSNIFAVSKRNINMALSTIHPESPTVESSKDMMTYIFARLQLKYTIQQLEVKDIDGDEATVEVLQVTQKLSGNAAFRDNRVKMLHTMKRDGKKWKMYSSEALLIEYLKY